MPKITPGNRLYLYQLLSREVGVGRQTLLPHVEEALAADGIAPEDLGCATVRELCEQLGEFVKLTVFKKGYVYATVLANEEYDRALERASAGADKAAAAGKPWKRKRGAKALKPVRPRHRERPAQGDDAKGDAGGRRGVAAEKDARAEKDVTPEKDAQAAAEAQVAPEPAAAAPEPAPAPAPEPEPEAAPTTEPAAETAPAAAPEPEPAPAPAPEPAPAPVPVIPSTPSIRLTVTYVPDSEGDGPEPAAGEPGPAAAGPEPAPTPGPAPSSAPVAGRVQGDLPRDFHADVRCPSEQLSLLYQVLPADVDPLSTLEEDFRVARSAGRLEGTRSNVTFSLRYLRSDGAAPVRVTLRRSARAVAGKRWTLAGVDAGAPEEVGLEGLSAARATGPWSAFAAAEDVSGGGTADPLRSLLETVELGPADDALGALASLAADEDWGPDRQVLLAHLAMTFARLRSEGKLAVSADGSAARFDTGLLDARLRPVTARLEATGADVPWRLAGFTTEVAAEPARYVTDPAQALLDASLTTPGFSAADAVARNPRMATPAYDPVANEARLLVPNGEGALALAVTPEGYRAVAALPLPDAYACARVVSADQPAWLLAGRG